MKKMELVEQDLSGRIIAACMEVSNVLGAGFLESVYHRALIQELASRRIQARSQCAIPVLYKGSPVGDYIADLLVEDRLILELKALSDLTSVHEAQLLNYLKGTGLKVGLLVNFGTPKIQWKRLVR
jgi:GxxExxY protein